MIQSIDHINLVVKDLATTVRFYTELLDFRVTNRATLQGNWIDSITGLSGIRADVVFLEPPQGGTRLEILQYHNPPSHSLPDNSRPNTGGLRHIAFLVNDIAATTEKLRNAGVQFLGTPAEVPAGILPQSTVRKSLCYFLDPDGVILELAEYRSV